MTYLYYPGCSLKSTGRAYEESILAVFKTLGVGLTELDDWNCCGATAYMSMSELKAFALCARNLAIAERQVPDGDQVNLVVPCAACYLGMAKAKRYLTENVDIRGKIDAALETAGLKYEGRVLIRHPLDVLVNDVGLKNLAAAVKHPLKGTKVASYYGCQLVRPYADFDDQYRPHTMDDIMQALGAEPVEWPLKTRCCGGSLTGTIQDVGLRLSYILLHEARRRGSDLIVTACPLCQFNLECYQDQINRRYGNGERLPVAYFSQLMGVALGIAERPLGLHRLFVPLRLKPAAAAAGGEHVHA